MTSPRALNGTKRRGSSFLLPFGVTKLSGRSFLRGGGGEVSLDIMKKKKDLSRDLYNIEVETPPK